MSLRLAFSNNSVRNTTITCDNLGLRYEVSKKHSTVSIARRDLRTNQIVAVAQYRLPFLDKEKIRFGDSGPWRPLKGVLYRKSGDYFGNAKSFMGSYGSVYRWKERDGTLVMVHHDKKKGVEPLVVYVRPTGSKNASYLEVNDSSVLNSLDIVVTTFLVMEKKRRNREAEDEILEGVADVAGG